MGDARARVVGRVNELVTMQVRLTETAAATRRAEGIGSRGDAIARTRGGDGDGVDAG